MKKIMSLVLMCFILNIIEAQIIPEGTYCIKYAYAPQFCMDLSENGKIANGQNILLWTYWGGNGQKWIVTHEKGGIVIRSFVNSNYVVDLLNGNATNDNNIQLHQYNGSAAQRWIPEYIEGHYILHSAVKHNICLDLYCGNATNGTNIQVYTDNRAWPQRWSFERIDGAASSGSSQGGHEPQLHIIVCPSCGGGGTLPWRNFITCKTCGGTGQLTSYQ